MVLDIIKDFAMVDRREYVPYCPLCTTIFTSSAEIQVFSCKHFLCVNCRVLLRASICPFCKADVEIRTGEFLGDAVTFLATWVTEVEQGKDRNLIVDQLIEQILMVRKNLKCGDLPCRIQAEGRMCSQVFKCPYDHKLLTYKKEICGIPDCPHGDRCPFMHPPPSKPVSLPPSQPFEESKGPAPSPQASSGQPTNPSKPVEKKGGPEKAVTGARKPAPKKGGEKACCLLS